MLQHMLCDGHEGIELNGLGDVFDIFAVEEKLIELAAGSAEDDHGDVGKIGVLAELLKGAAPVHAGHIDIKDDEAGQIVLLLEVVEQLEAFHAIRSFQELVGAFYAAQGLTQELQVILVVVHVNNGMLMQVVIHSIACKIHPFRC
jgi:hypothetical protein